MPGRHRYKPTQSPTLRAPLSEWLRDAWTVITHTLTGIPTPVTLDARARVATTDADSYDPEN
jgi:hypothetical protein